MRSATVAITVLLTMGCQEDWRDDYDFVWQGEHVTVYGYGHTEDEVCGGSFTELDGHTQRVLSQLGIEELPPIVFRWLSDDFWDQVDDTCQPGAYGCAGDGEVISRSLPHMHEVVHVLVDCPRLIDEGLAMYYDGFFPVWMGRATWEIYPPDHNVRDLMENGMTGGINEYTSAAHFVSYLDETYGRRFVELCEALPHEPTMDQWDDASRSVYGLSLEELLADYESYPLCSYSQLRAKLWNCLSSDFQFWAVGDEYVVETGCDDPEATNTSWNEEEAVLTRRIFVPKEMKIRVSSDAIGHGPDPIHIIQQCGRCSEDPEVFVENTDNPFGDKVRTYRGGLYEVSVVFDKDVNVRLAIEAVE